MNERRDYTQQWWPATYTGLRPSLRGLQGMACHKNGEEWAFVPSTTTDSWGMVTVHKDSVQLDPVSPRRVLPPRLRMVVCPGCRDLVEHSARHAGVCPGAVA